VNYPDRLSDADRHYIRYRDPDVVGPPAAAAKFLGKRVSVSASARFTVTGAVADASERVWFDKGENNGYVDIAARDTLVDLESYYSFTVLSVDDDGRSLIVSLRASQRRFVGSS